MILQEHDPAIDSARVEVLAWLVTQQVGSCDADADLVEAFLRIAAAETDLELRTQRNPSALVYEARWYIEGRELEEFPKPFCAEVEADARLLACAAMLHLEEE